LATFAPLRFNLFHFSISAFTPMSSPIQIPEIPGESYTEYILRLCAAVLQDHAPNALILHAHYDESEPVETEQLIESIHETLTELALHREREDVTMEFIGTIIQAGGESNPPTVTLATTKEQLKAQKNIPFFRQATIRITPIS